MKKSYRISSLLFSVCFFIYAISPLSAICQQKQVIEQTTSAGNGIKLFVVELLFSSLTQNEDGDDTSSRVLLRKKRATLSPDKLKTSKKQLKKDVFASSGIISSKSSGVWMVVQDNELKLQKGSHLPHSGLSPPSIL